MVTSKQVKKFLKGLGIDCSVKNGTGSMKNYINVYAKDLSFDFKGIEVLGLNVAMGRFGNIHLIK